MFIKEVRARAIKDSRGTATIEVSVNNSRASSPSGKSTGKYETPSYHQDLKWNIKFLNEWKKWLEIEDFNDLERVEDFIKKEIKEKDVKMFGANALYAFESAILKALALEEKKELWQVINANASRFPRPVGNAVGGGLHSMKFKKHPVFQEFLLIPKEKSFSDNVRMMKEVYRQIGKKLNAKQINDEGAWQTELDDEAALGALSEFKNIDIGVDVAASSFYKQKLYDYKHVQRTRPAHIEHVVKLIKDYSVLYVEDPVQEDDFEGFADIRKECREALVVGDDLTATHIDRLEKAIKARAIGAMIVKPNQNGSLLELKKIIDLCRKHKIQTVMSHRSGETLDDALADYAFAFQCDFIKCGIATKWRECKLKRMEEIEESLI